MNFLLDTWMCCCLCFTLQPANLAPSAPLLWFLCLRAPPRPGFTRCSLALYWNPSSAGSGGRPTDLLFARLLISSSQNLPDLTKPHFLKSSVPPLLDIPLPQFPAETSSLNSLCHLTATSLRPTQAISPGLPPAHASPQDYYWIFCALLPDLVPILWLASPLSEFQTPSKRLLKALFLKESILAP